MAEQTACSVQESGWSVRGGHSLPHSQFSPHPLQTRAGQQSSWHTTYSECSYACSIETWKKSTQEKTLTHTHTRLLEQHICYNSSQQEHQRYWYKDISNCSQNLSMNFWYFLRRQKSAHNFLYLSMIITPPSTISFTQTIFLSLTTPGLSRIAKWVRWLHEHSTDPFIVTVSHPVLVLVQNELFTTSSLKNRFVSIREKHACVTELNSICIKISLTADWQKHIESCQLYR